MAKLKYKDEDGFWQELPVGSNTEIVGTDGGKLYRHNILLKYENDIKANMLCYTSSKNTFSFFDLYSHIGILPALGYYNVNVGKGVVTMDMTPDEFDDQKFTIRLVGSCYDTSNSSVVGVSSEYNTKGSDAISLTDTVTEV